MENKPENKPGNTPPKKDKSIGNKTGKIRVDEFVRQEKKIPPIAFDAVKKHLKKTVGGFGEPNRYKSELDKFMNRTVR